MEDLEAGHGLLAEVRAAYQSGRTRTPAWRVQQLTEIARMLGEREGEIVDALFADLGKPAHEAYVAEVSLKPSTQWLVLVRPPGRLGCGLVVFFLLQ
jgi:acyl-CoA reductase-like NAD-dependent aldehyde dehydrogenase